MKSAKVFKVILGIIVAIFIINQLVSSLYMPIRTENAVFFTANDGFKITGHIIRNETYVTAKSDGVLHFVTADGSRVAKDGIIANIYSSATASITVSEIDVLKSQIADIEDILSYNDIEAANLDLINSKISGSLGNFIFESASGNFKNVDELSKELLAANNRKQVALGVATGLNERLEALKLQLAKLENSLPGVKGNILAAQSGYFVSKTDGYEKAFPSDDLSKITPEFLSSVEPKEKGGNVIGKIVSDYEWYIATVLPLNDSLKYKEDQELKLVTNIKSSPTLSVTVKQINISEETENAVIIFACNDMNSELATIRTANMTVVDKEYSGLRIPKKALRVVDSQKGVYVQSGMQISFVPVEIIYREDDYIICEKKNENGNFLKLYDKVVVKGKNLYDGKIVG
jgi:putative membrane fusion protein